jgi:hypothetical protein
MSDIQQFRYQAPRSKIRLVPGDIVYDYLVKNDPKKLKRMQRQEAERFQKTHASGWEEEFNASVERGLAANDRARKHSDDYKLLGLDAIEERVTKRIVKNAYRRAARKLHPDVGGSEEAFKHLQEVYHRVLAAAPKE